MERSEKINQNTHIFEKVLQENCIDIALEREKLARLLTEDNVQ